MSLAWAWIHSWKSKSSIILKISQINCICCFLHAQCKYTRKSNKICVWDLQMTFSKLHQKYSHYSPSISIFARIVEIRYSQLRISGLLALATLDKNLSSTTHSNKETCFILSLYSCCALNYIRVKITLNKPKFRLHLHIQFNSSPHTTCQNCIAIMTTTSDEHYPRNWRCSFRETELHVYIDLGIQLAWVLVNR